MFWKSVVLILTAAALNACVAAQQVSRLYEEEGNVALASGPKVVAMDGTRAPWVIEIEKKLRSKGFKVLRWATQKYVRQKTKDGEEGFNKATTRYVLLVDGDAQVGIMVRCFGGGWNFDYINVDLIDVRENKTVLNVSDAGYSEKCPPAWSNMFGNIANEVDRFWTGKGPKK